MSLRGPLEVCAAIALLGSAAGPARAQEVHEAVVDAGEGSDPYPVRLTLIDDERAAIRGDSRRRRLPEASGPGVAERLRGEMDLEACRAFSPDAADCTAPETAPRPELFAGARIPRIFTTGALEASGAAETPPGEDGAPRPETTAAGEEAATAPAAGGERDLAWLQGLVLPDLPVHWTERLIWYLERYREPGSYRDTAVGWLRRAGRFAGMMREVFRRHGLPEDLVWVAAIESSFDPSEHASSGAVGLWQFMPAGGRIYGLPQTRWVDQRRNPERSTEGAALYFRDLYDRFHSWDLALAGYNMGFAGLEKVILKYGCNDYWTLAETENALPWGTSFYVPKAIALAIVARNPEKFGITSLETDPAVTYDLVEVRGVNPVAVLARAAGLTVADFRALNPELLRDRTPPGEARWLVRVPAGTEERFVARLASAREEDQTRSYTVRFGESISDVAYRYRTTATRLRTLNGLERTDEIRGGDVLEVPDVEPRDLAAPEDAPVAVVPADVFVYPERRRLFYRTTAGDTLEAVAEAFRVGAADLTAWNEIDPEATLVPGLVLQLFAPADLDATTVLALEPEQVTVLVAGSEALFEHLAARDGLERIRYRVREADTLETIAARFGTSERALTRINRFGTHPDLQPGLEVLVYAKPEDAAAYRQEVAAEQVDVGGVTEVLPLEPAVEPPDEGTDDDEPPVEEALPAPPPDPEPATDAAGPPGGDGTGVVP